MVQIHCLSVIPTLLKTWNESVFVLDIDGKSYQLTSGSRKENLDNYILRFSPFSENSCKWNPLSEIRLMTPYEIADIELVANIICGVTEAKGNNKYWVESSKELLVGLLIYFLYKKFLKNPKYIYEFEKKIPITDMKIEDIEEFLKGIKNIQEVLKEMSEENLIEKYGKNEEVKEVVKKYLSSEYANTDEIMLQNALSEGKHPIAAKYLLNNSLLSKETFASVLETLIFCLTPFMVKNVRENMKYSDFRMVDLMNSNKPVSFYFHIPTQQTLKYKSFTELFIEQMFVKLLPENEDKIESRYRYKMLMLFDNFTTFGKIKAFEKTIGYAVAYGIKMVYTFPSMRALEMVYGKLNGILSNCNTQIFGVSDDELTAQYVSEICGKTTVAQCSQGKVSYEGVYAIKKEEFKKLPKNRLIIKRFGWNPIMAEKVKYYDEDLFKENMKLPFTITESLTNTSKQYIKLTSNQKKLFKELYNYNFNYLPSKFAISQIEKRLEDMKKEIDKMTMNYSELDKNDIERYNYLVRSYSNNLSEINNAKKALNYFLEIKEW